MAALTLLLLCGCMTSDVVELAKAAGGRSSTGSAEESTPYFFAPINLGISQITFPPLLEEPKTITTLQLRLAGLRVGMSQRDILRFLDQAANETFSLGCSHQWIVCCCPAANYTLTLSFSGETGFTGAMLARPDGKKDAWP